MGLVDFWKHCYLKLNIGKHGIFIAWQIKRVFQEKKPLKSYLKNKKISSKRIARHIQTILKGKTNKSTNSFWRLYI